MSARSYARREMAAKKALARGRVLLAGFDTKEEALAAARVVLLPWYRERFGREWKTREMLDLYGPGSEEQRARRAIEALNSEALDLWKTLGPAIHRLHDLWQRAKVYADPVARLQVNPLQASFEIARALPSLAFGVTPEWAEMSHGDRALRSDLEAVVRDFDKIQAASPRLLQDAELAKIAVLCGHLPAEWEDRTVGQMVDRLTKDIGPLRSRIGKLREPSNREFYGLKGSRGPKRKK